MTNYQAPLIPFKKAKSDLEAFQITVSGCYTSCPGQFFQMKNYINKFPNKRHHKLRVNSD